MTTGTEGCRYQFLKLIEVLYIVCIMILMYHFVHDFFSLHISSLWPEVVRHRIRDTYMYFGGSLVMTAVGAVAVHRSPRLMALMSKNSLMVRVQCDLDTIMTWSVFLTLYVLNFSEGT